MEKFNWGALYIVGLLLCLAGETVAEPEPENRWRIEVEKTDRYIRSREYRLGGPRSLSWSIDPVLVPLQRLRGAISLALAWLILLPGMAVAQTNPPPLQFSLNKVTAGEDESVVRRRLGEPDQVSQGFLVYREPRLRIERSYLGDGKIVSVTGEVPLEFGGNVISEVGSTPEQVHQILGEPDSFIDNSAETRPASRVEYYGRYCVVVYYKKTVTGTCLTTVTYSLLTAEAYEFMNTDPSRKQAPRRIEGQATPSLLLLPSGTTKEAPSLERLGNPRCTWFFGSADARASGSIEPCLGVRPSWRKGERPLDS